VDSIASFGPRRLPTYFGKPAARLTQVGTIVSYGGGRRVSPKDSDDECASAQRRDAHNTASGDFLCVHQRGGGMMWRTAEGMSG